MMRQDEYQACDALELAARVAGGEITPEELLETALARLEACNPHLNAVVIPMVEQARATLSAGLPKGPFRGVPFLLKDLYQLYAGVRTTNGCRLCEDFVPDIDSELVRRYKDAGLVIFGKTHSPEFGITTTSESRLFGQTRNPWNPEHSTGGSSGGSAAAVAAGIVPAAHASDGGGSIRIPAACCGVFGMKPTRARVPLGPEVGEGWSGMSVVHAVTRSVRDSAALLDASQGAAPGDPYWAPPPARPFLREVEEVQQAEQAQTGRLRIALQTESFNGSAVHPDCAAAARDAASLCEELGHVVEERPLQVDVEVVGEASRVIIGANLRASVEDRARALGRELCAEDVEPATWAMVQLAASAEAAEYARALKVIHGAGRRVAAFLDDVDLLLSPTMCIPPARLGELSLSTGDLMKMLGRLMASTGFTQLFNISGNPAMSVPLHWNAAGLPIGVQFAGRFGDEATLFRLAAELERARPWFERRPPV
jgi:Asp-tRNA(Asn)/Glu-tRNA(Gln) amidotransferase A subunit family amidase